MLKGEEESSLRRPRKVSWEHGDGPGGLGGLLGGGFPQDPSSEQKWFHSDNAVDEFKGSVKGGPQRKSFLV